MDDINFPRQNLKKHIAMAMWYLQNIFLVKIKINYMAIK